jgi:hypothetical protein
MVMDASAHVMVASVVLLIALPMMPNRLGRVTALKAIGSA